MISIFSFSKRTRVSTQSFLRQLHRILIEPPSQITDRKQQSMVRLFSALYVTLLPIILSIALLYAVTGSPSEVYAGLFMGACILTVSYACVRMGQLQIGFVLAIVTGITTIVIRAASLPFPHSEILLLVAVTLSTALIMPLRYTILVSILNTVIVVIFGYVVVELPRAIHQDYINHMLLTHSLIVLLTYYRNHSAAQFINQQAAAQARLELILAHVPGTLWTFDKHLKTKSINGYSLYLNETEGRTIPSGMLPRALHPHTGHAPGVMERVLKGETVTYEREIGQNYYQYTLQPLVQNDIIIGGIGMAIDVSEQRQAERQAQQLAAAKERTNGLAKFIHAASHDLRNPISAINANLYMMKRDPYGHKQPDRIAVIEYEINRLNVILNSFTTMAELERNEYLPTIPTDMSGLIRDLCRNVHNRDDQHAAQIQLHLAASLPHVPIHVSSMHRALANVLDNAVKFTPADGQVNVRVFEDASKLVIEVEDNGAGIAEADLPYVFDPFFRGAAHRPIEQGSTGLGLSIARRVIEQHKGLISVASMENAGTTIRITLPTIVSHADVSDVTRLPQISGSSLDTTSLSTSTSDTSSISVASRRSVFSRV